MTRVLRYPKMSALACRGAMLCALARDFCVSASLHGWARVLLVATLALLALCVALMSCRLFVDEVGIGVGFLLRVRTSPPSACSTATAAGAISTACTAARPISST